MNKKKLIFTFSIIAVVFLLILLVSNFPQTQYSDKMQPRQAGCTINKVDETEKYIEYTARVKLRDPLIVEDFLAENYVDKENNLAMNLYQECNMKFESPGDIEELNLNVKRTSENVAIPSFEGVIINKDIEESYYLNSSNEKAECEIIKTGDSIDETFLSCKWMFDLGEIKPITREIRSEDINYQVRIKIPKKENECLEDKDCEQYFGCIQNLCVRIEEEPRNLLQKIWDNLASFFRKIRNIL